MGRLCVVYGCNARSSSKRSISLHGFPKEFNRRRAWINFVKTTRQNFIIPSDSHDAICCRHFAPDCFEDQFTHRLKELVGINRRTLKHSAVPTILTDECLQALSKHAPSAASNSSFVDTDASCERRKRITKRDVLKSIHSLKNSKRDQVAETSNSGTNPNETSSDENDIFDVAYTTLPDTENIVPPSPRSTYKDVGVGPSGYKETHVYHHRSVMAKITPRVRSKGISAKPSNKTVATQCDQICMCNCGAEGISGPQSPNLTLKLKMPFSKSSKFTNNLDEEDTMDVVCDNESDSDWQPDDPNYSSSTDQQEMQEDNFSGLDHEVLAYPSHEERKYIVFQSSLLQLLNCCPCCKGQGKAELSEVGTLLTVNFMCADCGHSFLWHSQPLINRMPVGNLLLSGAILFTGSIVAKAFRLLETMNIACHTQKTFYEHQQHYLQPTIINKWLADQQDVLREASAMGGGLIIAGDGRSDSPGHNAKYGGFNSIECRLNKIIDIQIVQSNEVGNSQRCENEGLKRTFKFLKDKGHHVSVIITDRHKSNQKTIREDFKVRHYFDVWHVAKSVTKKLNQLANKKNMEKVGSWMKSIINHLHWVAASTPDGDPDTMVAKWLSILNHIADKHDQHDELLLQLNRHAKQKFQEGLFPSCVHRPLEGDDRDKLWFTPGDEDFEAVCKVVEDNNLLKDVRKLSPLYQTSSLESFHSLVIRFCPKHTAFSWLGMYCRLFLAAMHFNENSSRPVKKTATGDEQFCVHFPKAKKGDYSIKLLRDDPTYDYIKILNQQLFENYAKDRKALADSLPDRFCEKPDTLASTFEHPNAEEARSTYTSRFKRL